jgi:hypothetical protein
MPYAPVPVTLVSPVGVSKAVAVLLGVVIATDLASMAAEVNVYGAVSDFLGDGGYALSTESYENADLLYTGTSLAQFFAYIAAGIVFLVWFFRVRRNAGVFAPDVQTMRQGWSIGAWFIPIANFWLPRRIAGDVWAASMRNRPYSPAHLGAPAPRVSPALVNGWWAAWVVSTLLSQFAGARYDLADGPDGIKSSLVLLFLSEAADIVAAVLAILFVRELTRMQHRKAMEGPLI